MPHSSDTLRAVPGELSVVGFNDIPEAAANDLTTVRQPLVDKGREAARLLISRPNDGEQSKRLQAHLVTRGSSGPVA